jgi:hypothetical protein
MAKALVATMLVCALALDAQVSSPSQFRLKLQAEMVDEDGVHLASNAWEAPDGRRWSVIHKEFSSPTDARKYLDRQTEKNSTVIKRGDATDKQGKVIGTRVEIVFTTKESKQNTPAVLRTNGPHFYEILSDSFQHILDFENTRDW